MSLPGYINKTLLHSLTLDGTQAFQYNEFKPELEAKVKPVFLLFFSCYFIYSNCRELYERLKGHKTHIQLYCWGKLSDHQL